MKAIHINSTAPFFAKHKDGAYFIEKFDVYNAVISALQWRKVNGEISYITDTAGKKYIEKLGISSVWNSVEALIPDDFEGINPQMFWAAGKLLALREVSAPVAMIDTDFIVWNKLELEDTLVAAHEENITPSVYPEKSYFKLKKPFELDVLDGTVLPLNTAFLYLPDEDFKQYYVNQSLAFMKSAADCGDRLCYMVFAEQRLLAMCAKKLQIATKTLMDKDELFFPQSDFTHLWGAKQVLREDLGQRADFCRRARERIERDFPAYKDIIASIEKAYL